MALDPYVGELLQTDRSVLTVLFYSCSEGKAQRGAIISRYTVRLHLRERKLQDFMWKECSPAHPSPSSSSSFFTSSLALLFLNIDSALAALFIFIFLPVSSFVCPISVLWKYIFPFAYFSHVDQQNIKCFMSHLSLLYTHTGRLTGVNVSSFTFVRQAISSSKVKVTC